MAAIDEITMPGGVCVFFTETGGVERSLGNIVGDSVSIDRESDEIEHFTNKSGIRRKDKTFTVEENAQIDFEIDEINVDNMRYFFKGAAIATVGGGTAAIVDQKETLLTNTYISVEKPGLTIVSARQFLDNVFMFDGTVFTDHSVEADTLGGAEFTINGDADDFLYLGKATQWSSFDLDITIASSGYTSVVWEFWNGTAWTAVTVTGGTSNDFAQDDTLTFTAPATWTKNTVNAVNQFWLRFSQTAASPTAATVESIGRNSQQALVDHTDYDFDPGSASGAGSTKDGAIRRIIAGLLEPGEEVKVSFTYVTFTSQTFGIAEQSTIEGSARFVNNPQSGRGTHWEMLFPRCQLTNNGAMDLDDTDFQTIPLSLVALDNSAVDSVNPFGTVTVFP